MFCSVHQLCKYLKTCVQINSTYHCLLHLKDFCSCIVLLKSQFAILCCQKIVVCWKGYNKLQENLIKLNISLSGSGSCGFSLALSQFNIKIFSQNLELLTQIKLLVLAKIFSFDEMWGERKEEKKNMKTIHKGYVIE